MKMIYLFFALILTLGFTSCSINDDELMDVEQLHLSVTDPPPSEGAGEEDELEPNN